jgi:hypothetical protein
MISKTEYAARQKDLMSMMGENSIAVVLKQRDQIESLMA